MKNVKCKSGQLATGSWYFWLLPAIFFLFSCGSPTTESTTQQPTSPPPSSILIIGSSPSQIPGVSRGYGELLADELANMGLKKQVEDARQALGATQDLNGWLSQVGALLDSSDAATVVVDMGQMEAWVASEQESDNSLIPLEEFRESLGLLLQQIRQSGSKIVLLTPAPAGPDLPVWRNDRIQTYVQEIGLAANRFQVPVVDVWSQFMAYPDQTSGSLNELLIQDRYPNEAGQQRIAEELAATLGYMG